MNMSSEFLSSSHASSAGDVLFIGKVNLYVLELLRQYIDDICNALPVDFQKQTEKEEFKKNLQTYLHDHDFDKLQNTIDKISQHKELVGHQKLDELVDNLVSGIYLYKHLMLFQRPQSESNGNGFEFQTGRFNKEFVEKEKISEEGSYGILWRARHSVDGCYYAVKEIPFYYKDEEKLIRIKKEVPIQAKCCHPNVISYKTSWLEECIDINDYGISQSSSDLNLSSATITTIDQSGSNTLEALSLTEVIGKSEDEVRGGLLYIQMELCSQNLKTYIKKLHGMVTINNLTDEHMFKWVLTLNVYHLKNSLIEECLRIFLQTLKGVQHIHSKNLIHRDLKPQNILLDAEGNVKIADFGFATIHEASENSFVEINHSIGIRTPGYIAPEQLQGSNYNSKADMHSLGIILLELFCPGQTDSKFNKYIEDFKKFNKLPFILEDSFPDVAEIIRQLTQRDPEKRPTVSELLNTRLFLDQLIEQKKLKLQYLKQKKVLQEFVYQESIQINYLDSIHLSPPSLNYIEFESLSDRIYQFSSQSTSLFSIQSSERLESKSTMEVRYFSGIGILKFGKVIWISERKSNITNWALKRIDSILEWELNRIGPPSQHELREKENKKQNQMLQQQKQQQKLQRNPKRQVQKQRLRQLRQEQRRQQKQPREQQKQKQQQNRQKIQIQQDKHQQKLQQNQKQKQNQRRKQRRQEKQKRKQQLRQKQPLRQKQRVQQLQLHYT